jgi:hypothetical protein
MSEKVPTYLFRRAGIAASESVICVAPREIVASVFGGGGVKDAAGLTETFGGAAVFEDEEGERYYLGVWGSRNCSRFRTALRRAGIAITIVHASCPGRLKYYFKRHDRPVGRRRGGEASLDSGRVRTHGAKSR